MLLFVDINSIDLSRERIERELGIPDIPLNLPPPGFYMVDLLQWSYKGLLPADTKPWHRLRCKQARAQHPEDFCEWARSHYTWEQFLGEVNWLPDSEALSLLEMLLERDILHEMRRGILQHMTVESTPRSQRLPELERMLAWIRVGNRWAWWFDALREIPDPKYHPIPRLDFGLVFESSPGGPGRVVRHLASVERSLFPYSLSREFIEVIAAYVLYALGFQAEPPAGVSWDIWGNLVQSLDLDLMLRWPASYLGYLLAESKVGRGAAFFPTPMSVATLMTEMSLADGHLRGEGEDDPESVTARKRALCQILGEPAAGAGDMVLAASNYLWLGGPFWDIVPAIASAGRAQLGLYAPWFALSYLLADPPAGSLAAPDQLAQLAMRRQEQLILERQRATYAMEDWTRRTSERLLASPAAIDRVVRTSQVENMIVQHVRHRAEARATRASRLTLAALEDLLVRDASRTAEPAPDGQPLAALSANPQLPLFQSADTLDPIDASSAGEARLPD
jgi:hypothetical protein